MASPIDGLSPFGIKPSREIRGQIRFEDVKFAYPTRPSVLVCNRFSLCIEPGEVVAFGESIFWNCWFV